MKTLARIAMLGLALAPAFRVAAQPVADDWRQSVNVVNTSFDKAVKIESRVVRDEATDVFKDGAKTVQVFSFVDKTTGIAAHMLLLADRYRGTRWHGWQSAATNSAETMNIVAAPKRQTGSCNRYGCDHTEVIGAAVTSQMLEAAVAGDFQVRFSGEGVSYIARIQPEDARRQLAAVREVSEQVKAGTLPPPR